MRVRERRDGGWAQGWHGRMARAQACGGGLEEKDGHCRRVVDLRFTESTLYWIAHQTRHRAHPTPLRSPWSNEYDPPLDDGTTPSAKLRKLEVAANAAFDTYRELYFDGGLSSVYLWDLDDGGFAGVVLLKKSAPALV